MSRKLSIDTLRGLACILLVAYHVIGHDSTAGLRLPHDHVLPQANDVLALLRMPLFSFLSGFVYAWRPYSGNPQGFLKGKVRRLIVPMLLVGTLFALVQAYTPGANAGQYDWRLLHIVPVAHYWFLESLFIIFMATALLEHFALLSTPGRFTLVWLLAALAYLADPMPIYFGLQGATYLLPFFLLGLASNRFGEQLPRGRMLLAAGALLAGLSLYTLLAGQPMPPRTHLVALLISASGCVLLVRSQIELRWLAWIGVYSFAIYLFHSMFSAASRIVLLHLGVSSVPTLFAVGLVAGVSGPILAAAVLRRVPWGHLPLGESKPRESRPPAAVTTYADPTVPKQN
jgi:fucose 4-O-acetylase-like acetyltransferase